MGENAMAAIHLSAQSGATNMTQQWLKEAQQAGGHDIYDGKRKEMRTSWQESLEVHYPVGRGRTKTVYATARDLSPGGIGFECREAIPAYTEVLICRAGEIEGVRATTLHCTRSLGKFIVGCRAIVEESREGTARVVRAG
jgi:hypothetical protein